MAKDDDLDLDLGDDIDLGDDTDFGDTSDFGLEVVNADSRKPVSSVIKDSSTSFVNDFTDDKVQSILDIGRAAIPKALSSETDVVVNAYDTISEELRKQGHKFKIEAKRTARTIKRFIPGDDDSTIHKIVNKLSLLLGEDDEQITNTAGPTKAERVAAEIANLMGGRSVDPDGETKLRDQMAFLAQKDSKQLQTVAASNLERIRKFLFEVSNEYYRASLNVQIRQMYSTEELLAVTKTGFDIFKTSFEAVIKNTSLPDVVKVHNAELAGYKLKTKIINDVTGSLYKDGSPISNVVNKAKDAIKNYGDIVADTLASATGTLEMGATLKDQGITLGDVIGSTIASTAKETIGKLIGKAVSDTNDGNDSIIKIKNAFADPRAYLKKVEQANGLLSGVAGFTRAGMGSGKENFTVDKQDPNSAAYMDVRTKDSINKVIPNLLAKIHSEVKTSREMQAKSLGKITTKGISSPESKELLYDSNLDKLITRKELRSNIEKATKRDAVNNVSKVADSVTSILLEDSKKHYTKEEIKAIRDGIIKTVLVTGEHSTAILDSKYFKNLIKQTSPKLASKVNSEYSRLTKYRARKDIDVIDSVNKKLNSILTARTKHFNIAKDLVSRGLTDEAVKLGLVEQNEEGSIRGNFTGTRDMIIKQATEHQADIRKDPAKDTLKERLKGVKGFKDRSRVIAEFAAEQAKRKNAEPEDTFNKGYKLGGYTGDGKKDEPAGVVHKDEFVINQTKLTKLMDAFNKGNPESALDIFKSIAKEVKEQSKVYKDVPGKLSELAGKLPDKEMMSGIGITLKDLTKNKTPINIDKLKRSNLKMSFEKLKDGGVSEHSSKIRNKLVSGNHNKEYKQLKDAVNAVLESHNPKGPKYIKEAAREYAKAISDYILNVNIEATDYNLDDLMEIVEPSVSGKVKQALKSKAERISNLIKPKFLKLEDRSYLEDNEDLAKEAGKEVPYVDVWDSIPEDKQGALRLEFFSSEIYKNGSLTDFALWLRDFKHIDPGTLGTAKGIISDKFLNIKKDFTSRFNKTKDEIMQEMKDRLTGKALKELKSEQEEDMRKQFFESPEYIDGHVKSFDDWLKAQGMRRNGTSIFSRLRKKYSIKNILKNTRKLDRKVASMLYGGVLKGAVKAPAYLAKSVYDALPGTHRKNPTILGKAVALTAKTAGGVIGAVGGGIKDAVVDTATSIPGVRRFRKDYVKKPPKDKSKASLLGNAYRASKTIVGGTARVAGTVIGGVSGAAKDSIVDTIMSIPGLRRFKKNDKDESSKNSVKSSMDRLINYFKNRDIIADKKTKLKAKMEKIKEKATAKHNRFLAMFANENNSETDPKKKKGGILSKIVKGGKSLLTPTTVLLGIAALMKASDVTVKDIKDGVNKTREVIGTIWDGMKTGWGWFKSTLNFIGDSISSIRDLPANLSYNIREALSHVWGLGNLKPSKAEDAAYENRHRVDANGNRLPPLKLDSNNNPVTAVGKDGKPAPTKEEGGVSNLQAAGYAAGGYGLYKAGRGVRNIYKGGKAVVGVAKKVAGVDSKAAKVANKIKPKKPGMFSKISKFAGNIKDKVASKLSPKKGGMVNRLSKFLGKIKSRIAKKLSGKLATKAMARIAARMVPVAGAALLAYDIGKTVYYMAKGDNFPSAASKAILGIDLFTDEPDSDSDATTSVIDAEKLGTASMTMSDESNGDNLYTGGNIIPFRSADKYIELPDGVDINGMNPALRANLVNMARDYYRTYGKKLKINSGYRSMSEQRRLYETMPRGKAARPGHSLHNYGLAVDIDTPVIHDLDKAGLIKKYGFTQPMPHETWHLEPIGIEDKISLAKKNKSVATQAIKDSLGRGTLGWGQVGFGRGRNPDYYKEVLASTEPKKPSTSKARTVASEIVPPAKVIDIQKYKNNLTTKLNTKDKIPNTTKDNSNVSTNVKTASVPSIGDSLNNNNSIINNSKENRHDPNVSTSTDTHATITVNIDDSKHLPAIAEATGRSVDIQQQMLVALGDIANKLDNTLGGKSKDTPTSDNDNNSINNPTISKLPDPAIDIKRRVAF